jgi:PAS domain-containing protein
MIVVWLTLKDLAISVRLSPLMVRRSITSIANDPIVVCTTDQRPVHERPARRRDDAVPQYLDGVITSWNHGAGRLFGYAAEEMIGKPITILIPTERLDEEKTSSLVFAAASASSVTRQVDAAKMEASSIFR